MSGALLFLSIYAACLPITLYVLLIWWLDRYEREPPLLVVAAFCWGAIYAVLLAGIGSAIASLPFGGLPDAIRVIMAAAFIAPLVEEPAKAAVLWPLSGRRQFDGPVDGIVYGATAGLGFAMTENLLYFWTSAAGGDVSEWLSVVVVRTCLTAPMHAMATSFVGAAAGWGKWRTAPKRRVAVACGLIAACAVHATWNGLLSLDGHFEAHGRLIALAFVLLCVGLLMLLVLFQWSVNHEGRLIHAELKTEAERGTLSPQTADALSNWWTRRRGRWAPPGLDVDAYIHSATQLALRRIQSQYAGEEQFQEEIEALRQDLLLRWHEASAVPPRQRSRREDEAHG